MNVETVRRQQHTWAIARNLSPDSQHYLTVDQNLFQPLHHDTERELTAGRGGELAGRRPRLAALHSSGALVCNVFDYWRGRALSVVASAFGADLDTTDLRFERPYPTAAGGIPPHLDVELSGGDIPTAIESKFLEPYTGRPGSVKHFYAASHVWKAVGLLRCAEIARAIIAGHERFERLGVNQLLAHMLGLASAHRDRFRLIYLWFDFGGAACNDLRAELSRLAALLEGTVRFEAVTYQEIFGKMAPALDSHADYRDYLRDRYFPRLAP